MVTLRVGRMRGGIRAGRFYFEPNSGEDGAEGLRHDLFDGAFGDRLSRRGPLPELSGAPLGSWVLARLARLAATGLGLGGEEHIDGGGYVIEFAAYEAPPARPRQPLLFDPGEYLQRDELVAVFQLQADADGVVVIGDRAVTCSVEGLLEAFAAALTLAPAEISPCELAVVDPDWFADPGAFRPRPTRGSRNRYGWDGTRFLGADNIRPTPPPNKSARRANR